MSGAAAGALGTMLVMITAAGCRDGAQSGGSGGTGDGVARTPTLAGQLPRVAASASLERADEWVPAHGVWLGVDGTIVVAPTPERWAALATGGLAGRRVALAELASVVAVARDEDKQRHDQAQGRERAREAATERAGLIAGGLTPEQADERMANTHVDYGDIVLGPVYAERPPSTIPIAGDLAPVRDGAPARAVVLTAAPADPNPTEPFLLVPAARARPAPWSRPCSPPPAGSSPSPRPTDHARCGCGSSTPARRRGGPMSLRGHRGSSSGSAATRSSSRWCQGRASGCRGRSTRRCCARP